jgi:nitroreductase
VPGLADTAPGDVVLPAPQPGGGRPLFETLAARRSERAFSPEPLPPAVLGNLLWAAFGINRPDSGRRTAPSCRNWQEIDLYAATRDGLFLYDAKRHALSRVLDTDVRGLCGRQDFVRDAPLNLVYVADRARMAAQSEEDLVFFAGTDTGLISQNVYLFCASEGLATVVRALIDKPALAAAMKLRPEQRITLAQTVGYPRK